MELSYLIRYGLWNQVGRFAADSPDLRRGQTVVVRSHRGTELGEVLIRLSSGPDVPPASGPPETTRVLRAADPDDLERARQLDLARPLRFDLCQRVIRDRDEVLELIDVEPLLDDRRTVLHYLGPRDLDASELLVTLRSTCNIDGLLAYVGSDLSDEPEASEEEEDPGHGCGQCGSGGGGCGSGGGCATGPESSHGGCSDCGIKRLLKARPSPFSR